MTHEELLDVDQEVNQLENDIRSLTGEVIGELRSLSAYAMRGDALAVASVAYRVRQYAMKNRMPSIEETAARIEDSARRNNVNQFTSDIQLLDHQLRWHTRGDRQ